MTVDLFDSAEVLPAREAIIGMVRRKMHVLNSAGKMDMINRQWEKLGKPMPAFYKKVKAA